MLYTRPGTLGQKATLPETGEKRLLPVTSARGVADRGPKPSDIDMNGAAHPDPDAILATYDEIAGEWDNVRDGSLFEKPWIDQFLSNLSGPIADSHLLDVGCGTGRPLALYIAQYGASLTGLDGSKKMAKAFVQTLPDATAIHADMRQFDLGRKFDGIIAWNSLFHLTGPDQALALRCLARHAESNAPLLLTTGARKGDAVGSVAGNPVYHHSLSLCEYRDLFSTLGIEVLAHCADDPDCGGATVWLGRFTGVTAP